MINKILNQPERETVNLEALKVHANKIYLLFTRLCLMVVLQSYQSLQEKPVKTLLIGLINS